MTTTKATIGSISSGTLRTEDLLDSFAAELNRLIAPSWPPVIGSQPERELIRAAHRLLNSQDDDHRDRKWEESASALVDDLLDGLNEWAPEFCYFGAHPGDGADYGFWPDHDRINDEILAHAVEVQKGEFIYADEMGEAYHVSINDHGNMTIRDILMNEILLDIV
jgi:hypothetical protein